ncbi:MAG: HEPN domain-containing protein [Clostridia bacterium]
MELKFKRWQDFNNLSIKVTINKKIYDAILNTDNNRLILKINMTKDINEWRKTNKNYDIISGRFLFNSQKIFFINCIHTGHESSMNCQKNIIENATSNFIVDRLIIDKNISKTSLNNILKYSASYKNLDLFSELNRIMPGLREIDYDSNTCNYKINTPFYSMNIMFYCSTKEDRNSLIVNRMSHVEFEHSKGVSIKKVLENIYRFRNFLMIILKQPIYVKKQTIYINDNAVELFDCNDNDDFLENPSLEEMLSHRCLKINNIDNIETIYNNFIKQYNQLYPLIELYYNVTQYKIPNLTRFINATTMLEYYSRTYDYINSLTLSKNKNPKRNDPYYECMVLSLINNVNEVFNCTSKEIDTISENIKAARIHYIHYKTNQKSKTLTDDEQFWYSYFMQDVVLLNIYKLLGLDISKYEYVSFNDFFYNINDIL